MLTLKQLVKINDIIIFSLLHFLFITLLFTNIEAIEEELKQQELTNINSASSSPTTDIFKLPQGYNIEPILWNLSLPSSITFDDKGNMYIAESGFVYGGLTPIPRILKQDADSGTVSVLIDRNLNGPITDIEFHNGKLYISHRSIISTLDLSNGLLKDIIVGLPSIGDHHNNQLAFGPDGKIYFGQGEATNSGIVGKDNFNLGWLKTYPEFHDRPAMDITLTGQNFVTQNPLTAEPNDTATTGAFVPFGTSTKEGQVIKGNIKCNGCVLSANLDGTDLKLVGWGFRSAYGMSFSSNASSLLLVTVNGADERGSRPIANDTEKIYIIDTSVSEETGQFYGWPDFFGNGEPVTDPKFQSERSNKSLQFLIQDHPPVRKPFAQLEVGAALAQVVFSPQDNNFGFQGMAFIAEFGIMMPILHPDLLEKEIIGQKIIVFNPQNKSYNDFLSLKIPDSNFRPVGVAFNQHEDALYVSSIGKVEIITKLHNGTLLSNPIPCYYQDTGIIWKITKSTIK